MAGERGSLGNFAKITAPGLVEDGLLDNFIHILFTNMSKTVIVITPPLLR